MPFEQIEFPEHIDSSEPFTVPMTPDVQRAAPAHLSRLNERTFDPEAFMDRVIEGGERFDRPREELDFQTQVYAVQLRLPNTTLRVGDVTHLTGIVGAPDGDFRVMAVVGNWTTLHSVPKPLVARYKGREIPNPPTNLDFAFSHGWVPNRADEERLWAGTMSSERLSVIIERATDNRQRYAWKGKKFLPDDDMARMKEAWRNWDVSIMLQDYWMMGIEQTFARELFEMDKK